MFYERKKMEKKVAFVSFGRTSTDGKFRDSGIGRKLSIASTHVPSDFIHSFDEYNELWEKSITGKKAYIDFCKINGWNTDEKEFVNAFIYVDQSGWDGCGSAWDSFGCVFGEYKFGTTMSQVILPRTVVDHMLAYTDDKVLNVKLPMRNNCVRDGFEVKVFDVELHMVDDYTQLPEKLI